MNFSEYTLVSFGDSFTFGQDVVSPYDKSVEDLRPVQKQYKIDSNNLSYTKFLADSLGFKDSLNFGTLAASNERSLMHLETFLRNNPTKKVFVLFNFTSQSRFLNIFKDTVKSEYVMIDVYPNIIGDDVIDPKRKYMGINKKSIEAQYTFWRNSVQDAYSHIRDRRNLYYMLSSHNTPHASFDIINTMDSLILRDNPIKYMDSYEGHFNSVMHSDENYIFKELDFFNSYYKELADKSPLLTHIQVEDLNGYRNVSEYVGRLSEDPTHYISEHGMHWNIEGHIEVAKVIEKFINERYN